MDLKVMTLNNVLPYDKRRGEASALHVTESRWTYCLFISSTLGVGAGLVGMVIGAFSLIGLLDGNRGIQTVGTWLIVAAFPLLILAAHCLDKAREAEKAMRLEHCRRHGLKDDEC